MSRRADTCLERMWKMCPALCDVVLKSEDGRIIPVHRVVLASSLEYFESMFLCPFAERNQPEVEIKKIDGDALFTIVQWCYIGSVTIREDNVQHLMTGATMLRAEHIVSECVEYLRAQLTPENALGIHEYAEVVGSHELGSRALTFIHSHFLPITQCTDEFLKMEPLKLSLLLASDLIETTRPHIKGDFVVGERAVLEAIVNWIKYDPEKRRSFLSSLIQHVRFPRMSQETLVTIDSEYPILDDPNCKDLLLEALKYQLAKSALQFSNSFLESNTIQVLETSNNRFKERCPIGRPHCLLVIGGQSPKAVKSCEYYDFDTDKWMEMKMELPERRCRAGLVFQGGSLYLIGGFNGEHRVRTVDSLDVQKQKWNTRPPAPLQMRRSTLGVAKVGAKIYAVGGFDGYSGLNSAEVYDPNTDKWTLIAPMSTKRSSVGVAENKGLLYAVGGYCGESRQCLASVEYYMAEANAWTRIPDMSMRRSGAAVCFLDGRLIVCGGHDGPAVRKSVEAYDPATQKWTQLSDMIIARRNAGVVVRNGMLYVVGGDDSFSNLSSMETYNPIKNQWVLSMVSMSLGRSYAGVSIIEKCWN